MLKVRWMAYAALAMISTLFIKAPLFAQGDKSQSGIAPKTLGALYSTYLGIQKALARDDLEAARTESRTFLKQQVKFPPELSPKVKAEDILSDFKALNGAKDIAAYRKAFSPFSDRMVLLMSEAKYQGGKPVLEFECPMANGNKGGKWLQAEKGVANPYFGSAMLTCGTLKNRLHDGAAKESTGEK